MSLDVRWLTAFLDEPAASAQRSRAFWEAVTACSSSPPRGEDGEFRTLLPATGDPYLRTQVLADGPSRIHLDLHVDDLATATDEAVRLGACVTDRFGTHVVLASPGGMVFCLVPYDGEGVVPAAHAWPHGGRSRLDQVSLDIGPAAYESECAFWSALTGWKLRDLEEDEFRRLVRPRGMPLRILLQRLDDPAERVTAHLDLAAGWDDADAEVERVTALGAQEVRRSTWWVTLRDPCGRVFCVTRRDP